MTLVLSAHSRDTLWLVVDRRLSYGGRRPPVDDAVKVMHLETTDGVGLLAYAGLGATSFGTQPSDWMSAVLRGHAGLTFEQALGILSTAANKQLPKHLARMQGRTHFIIVPAFVRDVGSRLYSIDNILDTKAQKHLYRYTSHQVLPSPGGPSVRLAIGGSGGDYLAQNLGMWRRDLHNLLRAHDRGRVSDHLIADRLARLNYVTHQQVSDGTVGPRSIVIWRRRPDARPGPGGGHQFYTGVERDEESTAIPTITNGMDVRSVAGVLLKQMGWVSGGVPPTFPSPTTFNKDEMDRLLANLPSTPDEKLR